MIDDRNNPPAERLRAASLDLRRVLAYQHALPGDIERLIRHAIARCNDVADAIEQGEAGAAPARDAYASAGRHAHA